MLNCGLGVIAFPIVGVVMLFKGNDILDFMNMIFGSEREGMLIVLVVTALSLLASMNDMVVPSVSGWKEKIFGLHSLCRWICGRCSVPNSACSSCLPLCRLLCVKSVLHL